ncbi:disease resistance protein RPM1-like [Cornus florida]|uniref:disease resistance protein RPM1-like n=1 Tax=Cornus florida TaxID=4283 RepID=UPI0028990C62|nr:disease resistance protein RPM1-like [Cornus florida]XP_059656667.1 disease resistance protein RPM1-like [Cornus florida]XP_059656675.1 disease resistance protein RPM1-like [Cornus florida]XP_059656683.1 disease resistance protein RPM1-like [Cornus florida]XP_059656687.1 disease resistance protein RPM1-like [Cornus florida]XP_059656694.1 disease resistance protein RPM1-like [Cornus florida]XP_059656703.1 disease resistance protein RPM1-like [Cornus florida]
MAQDAVCFLLDKLQIWLEAEWKLPGKISTEVDILRGEFESISALLKDADTEREHNSQVTDWLQKLRDGTYDIEDLLDIFTFHMVQQSISHGFEFVTKWRARHHIDELIEGINMKLKSIKEAKERYHNSISPSQASSLTTGNDTCLPPRIDPLFAEDTDIVGIEIPKKKLITWALKGRQSLKVVFVVGMGGLGKTTIVKQAYEMVKNEGFECHAWITVGRSINKMDLLTMMFNKFCNLPVEPTSQSSSSFNLVELMNKLRDHLQNKRYVLVLDDLWKKDVWESIRKALPEGNHSRIIITTRRGDIAFSCRDNSTDVYNIQSLPTEKAKQLFHKNAFPDGICPSRLEGWSQRILTKCEGLPLAIIEIGKILYRENSASAWQKLLGSLGSELSRNGSLSDTMRILSLSYSDLPYHLKYCFLYLTIFPENDYPVRCRVLIRLWIAEGFIREQTGKEVEDIGEEYLKELTDRNLIQSELDFDGRPKTCRVHNLMHKIILSKSREENFCNVFSESQRNIGDKPRRLSMQSHGFNKLDGNFKSVRTLFVFGVPYSSIRDLKLLRVLHLEGASLEIFPKEIVGLLLLKYLCLRNNNIKIIPESLGNLRYLETLDLRQTRVVKLPKKVLELKKLRHLLVYYTTSDCVTGFEISAEIQTPSLQKLSFIKANSHHKVIHWLRNLTQLRKLGIIDLPREDGSNLCQSIEKLQNLLSLNVTSLKKDEVVDLQAITNPPPFLQRLNLKGRLERLPIWITRLHDLVRIRLKWSKLTHYNNPIDILQDLPNLLELQLLDACSGNQLDFTARKFQTLKILELEQLEPLRKVRMEETTLPYLQKLIIRQCNNLQQVPEGIRNLTRLKELHLYDMPYRFVAQIKNGGTLRHLVRHIPNINCYYLETKWVADDLNLIDT